MKNKGMLFPVALIVAVIISSSSLTLAATSTTDNSGSSIPIDFKISLPVNSGTTTPADGSATTMQIPEDLVTALTADGSGTTTQIPENLLISIPVDRSSTATPTVGSTTATPALTDLGITLPADLGISIPAAGSGTTIPAAGSGTTIPAAGSGTTIPTANTGGYGFTAPTAAFSVTQTTWAAPYKMTFTDKSTGQAFSYNWDFGGGSTSFEQNPVHSYAKAGKYNVKLEVFGMGSNAVTKAITVAAAKPSTGKSSTVKPSTGKAPVAAFTSCVSGKTVKFTDKSTGTPKSYLWDFGDKCTSTAKNPSHKYAKAGKYTVSLTAKNSAGSNKKCSTVTVK